MKIQIKFFEKDYANALEPGIYKIEIKKDNQPATFLYIGESEYPFVRCSEHLYNLKKESDYFGFNEQILSDPSITLIFSLIENNDCLEKRKIKEKDYIKQSEPICQSGISDRLDDKRAEKLKDWYAKLQAMNQE